MPHRILRFFVGLVGLLALLIGGRAVVISVGPTPADATVERQLAFLRSSIDAGAPAEAQRLFPEGEFFMLVLTGLAEAQSGHSAAAAALLEQSGRPEVAARFGDIDTLEHGTFYRGWRLLLAAEIASRSTPPDAALQTEADTIEAALLADPDGVPESYPGGRWPCDAVVAMAAVVRAHELAGRPTATAAWLAKIDAARDPDTHLLGHQLSATRGLVGAQGSSQAIIQTFWPTVSQDQGRDWQKFRDAFVTREFGLVGIREHPVGTDGQGDVDSGPLVLGVSASASAVALGAARANGDANLATDLDREAELLGMPFDPGDGRRFAGGILPIGDAWVAWARTVEWPDTITYVRDKRPLLLLYATPPLGVAALCAWLVWGPLRSRTRQRLAAGA